MKMRDLLETWGLKSLKLSTGFVEGEFAAQDPDRDAAWDLYVELVTRIATQRLPGEAGDEVAALRSIYDLWGIVRSTLKAHRGCTVFAKLTIPFFNQDVRPFTARWHKQSIAGALDTLSGKEAFRQELESLRARLVAFTGLLSAIAGVEDITPEIMADAEA